MCVCGGGWGGGRLSLIWLIPLCVMSMMAGLTVGALTECQSHFGQTTVLAAQSLATSIIDSVGRAETVAVETHGCRGCYILGSAIRFKVSRTEFAFVQKQILEGHLNMVFKYQSVIQR